jgi:phosphonate transport system permease protein
MNTATPSPEIDIPSIPLPPAPSFKGSLYRTFGWVSLVCLLVWGWIAVDMRPMELIEGGEKMREMILGGVNERGFKEVGFLPGSLSWSDLQMYTRWDTWSTYTEDMIITIHMAIWSTLLAVFLAIPFGLLSAENVTPLWLRQPVRRLMDTFRAINELVFALIFVVAVGLGPMAGVLALWIHTTGILAKLFSEAVESVDHRPVDGITVTGAGKLEEVLYGVIPQVIPFWISYALYRFESNVRSATVVGLIGAGGIGMALNESMRSFNYDEAGVILFIIVIAVIILDVVSGSLRKSFL